MDGIIRAIKSPVGMLVVGAVVGVIIDSKTGLITRLVHKASFGRLP